MNAPLTKEQIALLMSDTLSYRAPGVEGGLSVFRPSLFARLRAAVAHLASLPRRRAVMDELSMLTDRELADIGLNRSELGRVFDPRFVQARKRMDQDYAV
jgi:uncharacterized protein YjiS (DUF1127 family)